MRMSDMCDAKSIYFLLKDHPEIPLMSPPKSFDIPKQPEDKNPQQSIRFSKLNFLNNSADH